MQYLDAKSPGPGEDLISKTLYFLWGGTNDYLDSIDVSRIGPNLVEEVLGNISLAVDLLIDYGATR